MLRLLAILSVAALLADQAPATRAIVVISDLHMGPGRDASGQWHPYEDFRWRDEFIAFLNALNQQGGDIDLVVNGDLFELLQSPSIACGNPGCTVPLAIQRLATAARAHADELIALGKFAAARGNRLYIVPGDHDGALLVLDVWQRVLPAFAAPVGRVTLVTTGQWTSPDGRVHVEHGHQLPLSVDRFSNWPNPWVSVDGRTYVERPWGEQVVLPFYNFNEPRYPIVDNIAEEGVGVKFVAARAGAEPPADPAAMLRVLLMKTTWQQFRMDLDDGEVQAPVWDLSRIRAELGAFMAASLPSDDPFAPVAKTIAPANLAAAGAQLSDQQIVAICDYRAAIRRARRRMERVLTQLAGVGPPIAECPRMPDTVGPAFEYYWRSRDQQVRNHIGNPQALDVIVFGHTHLLDRPFRPFGEDGPVVVTSGAWQRTVHPNDIKQLDAPLESLAPCYSFVRIPAGSGPRTIESRSWRINDQQQWAMTNGGC